EDVKNHLGLVQAGVIESLRPHVLAPTSGLGAFEDSMQLPASSPEHVHEIHPVRDKSPTFYRPPELVNRWQPVSDRKLGDPAVVAAHDWRGDDDHRLGPCSLHFSKNTIEVGGDRLHSAPATSSSRPRRASAFRLRASSALWGLSRPPAAGPGAPPRRSCQQPT